MRASIRYSVISRLGGAVAAIWLCGAVSAWAGVGGGGDVASAQKDVAALCTLLNIPDKYCRQLPTATQLLLEITGLENTSPDIARYAESFSPTVAVNAVNPPAGNNPFDLTKVTPVAFVPSPTPGGTATLTVPDDPLARSFFYAATDGAPGTAPVNLILVYDYLNLTNPNFAKNQLVAKLSLPLVILNTSNNTETEAPTTILITGATGCGKVTPCVSATATSTGIFAGVSAASLGINVTLDFSPGYARFTVQAPLLVTHTTDPAYFTTNQAYGMNAGQFFYSGLPTSFINDVGVTNIPKSLGLPIGVAPYAAPQCPNDSTGKPQPNCATANPLPSTNFPFCASITADGNNGTIFPAVAAFYSIGTFGTTYLSAPLKTPANVSCSSLQ